MQKKSRTYKAWDADGLGHVRIQKVLLLLLADEPAKSVRNACKQGEGVRVYAYVRVRVCLCVAAGVSVCDKCVCMCVFVCASPIV